MKIKVLMVALEIFNTQFHFLQGMAIFHCYYLLSLTACQYLLRSVSILKGLSVSTMYSREKKASLVSVFSLTDRAVEQHAAGKVEKIRRMTMHMKEGKIGNVNRTVNVLFKNKTPKSDDFAWTLLLVTQLYMLKAVDHVVPFKTYSTTLLSKVFQFQNKKQVTANSVIATLNIDKI